MGLYTTKGMYLLTGASLFAVFPLNTWMRLSCRLHSFNMKNKLPCQTSPSGTALFQLQAGFRPGNIWQGAGRQHGWCLPSTR